MATSYRTILIHPGARSFTSAGLIARFPMSMVGISTILAVEELYGSYTAAGLVSAANFVAMAIGRRSWPAASTATASRGSCCPRCSCRP